MTSSEYSGVQVAPAAAQVVVQSSPLAPRYHPAAPSEPTVRSRLRAPSAQKVVGLTLGAADGDVTDGAIDGEPEGAAEKSAPGGGPANGEGVGTLLGAFVGSHVGTGLGPDVGLDVGDTITVGFDRDTNLRTGAVAG